MFLCKAIPLGGQKMITDTRRSRRIARCVLVVAVAAFLSVSWPSASQGQVSPAVLPRTWLDTTYAPPTGTNRCVQVQVPPPGCTTEPDFQTALNDAQPGDVIILQAGTTYLAPLGGGFVLPSKAVPNPAPPGFNPWIYIRSSAYASLLPPGSRVSPSQANLMPKIVTQDEQPAIHTGYDRSINWVADYPCSPSPGDGCPAHHYRFVGIEITSQLNTMQGCTQSGCPAGFPKFLASLVLLMTMDVVQQSLSLVPTDFVFDRCYIHGTPTDNVWRAITVNSARTAVIDSYLSEFHDRYYDTSAIMGWNGPGPFKIVNNYLEAAGENVMFGGNDATIPNLVPSDIEIRGNHFFKPLSWRGPTQWPANQWHSWTYSDLGDPSFVSADPCPNQNPPSPPLLTTACYWRVKNDFELKNAQYVLVEGNIFENSWVGWDQDGFAIVFTPRNQSGGNPWAIVADVTVRNNVIRRTVNGVFLLGQDTNYPSQQLQRVLIQNNLFFDIGKFTDLNYMGELSAMLFLFKSGPSYGTRDVTINHNTAFLIYPSSPPNTTNSGSFLLGETPAHTGLNFFNTIIPNNRWGPACAGVTPGDPVAAMDTCFPNGDGGQNVIYGPWAPSNTCPTIPSGSPTCMTPSNYGRFTSNNYFPASVNAVGFTDLPNCNFRLTTSSPYYSAGSDGTAVGINQDALEAPFGSGSASGGMGRTVLSIWPTTPYCN